MNSVDVKGPCICIFVPLLKCLSNFFQQKNKPGCFHSHTPMKLLLNKLLLSKYNSIILLLLSALRFPCPDTCDRGRWRHYNRLERTPPLLGAFSRFSCNKYSSLHQVLFILIYLYLRHTIHLIHVRVWTWPWKQASIWSSPRSFFRFQCSGGWR